MSSKLSTVTAPDTRRSPRRTRRASATPCAPRWRACGSRRRRCVMVWNWADSASISRRKSCAAKRPSPSALGGVLEVAAIRVPDGDQFGQQPRHQPGVARVVELELVDAQQRGAGEQLHRGAVAERADQRGVFDERAEVLPSRRHVPQRGKQVGLADAEATVQVDPGQRLRRRASAEESASCAASLRAANALIASTASRLRRVVVVRPVRLERSRAANCRGGTRWATISAPESFGLRSSRLPIDRCVRRSIRETSRWIVRAISGIYRPRMLFGYCVEPLHDAVFATGE